MTNYELVLFVAIGSVAAGFLGALTGLGGGVVLVPMLTLLFGIDLRYAIGASLVSVIATSSGAAAAYVKEGYSNLRVGMFLEVATTAGAIGGAYLAVWLNPSLIAVGGMEQEGDPGPASDAAEPVPQPGEPSVERSGHRGVTPP